MKKFYNNGIKNINFGSSDLHNLLFNNKVSLLGENLTIMVLSCNRSSSTIKLLDSIIEHIPNFLGEVLIIDNNSNENEKNIIKKYLSSYPFCNRIIEFDKNYGVAGGRNRAIDYVETDWVMSLDNDIYLISNPLESISESIATLGCMFLDLPLIDEKGENVFSYGGHLYLDIINNDIHVGGGSLYKQGNIKEYNNEEYNVPSLCTFALGGASVFNKKAFIECGKYDEGYFIGFEDTDFSITLFNKGYKIGVCPSFSLIHNHVIDLSEESKKYERTRFSSDIIYKSAMHFEEKWGFKVWNANLELWLKERQKELGIIEDNTISVIENSKPVVESNKKKIALIVDVQGWAFWNIASQIKLNLSKYYEIEIICMEYFNYIYDIFFYLKKFDLIHFFWRGHFLWFNPCDDSFIQANYGYSYDNFMNSYVLNKTITTSVYDHLYLNEDELDNTNKMLNFSKEYTVSSNKLFDIYNLEPKIIKKPKSVITDGVDLNKFYPINLERFEENSISKRKIVIGWVGNSAWNGKDKDMKGVNTILKPAILELSREGYEIEMYFADKQERMIPHDKMCEYYSKIDILACSSLIEGTPNPVLEAMACGVPVITSDVGIVNELLGKEQKKYIIKYRNKNEFKKKLIYILKNRELLKKLSEENLKSIKSWTWKEKTTEFRKFFEEVLSDK